MTDVDRLRLLAWRHRDPSSVRAVRGELVVPRGWPRRVDGPALVRAHAAASAATPGLPAWDFVKDYLSGAIKDDDDD